MDAHEVFFDNDDNGKVLYSYEKNKNDENEIMNDVNRIIHDR